MFGLAQRRDAANDDFVLPSYGLTEDGETALRFNWTEVAELLERLAREAQGAEPGRGGHWPYHFRIVKIPRQPPLWDFHLPHWISMPLGRGFPFRR